MEEEINLLFRKVLSNGELPVPAGAVCPAVSVFLRETRKHSYQTFEHEHPYYELIIPVRGTVSCRIDGKNVTAPEKHPCLILIPPLTPHVRSSPSGCTTWTMHLLMKHADTDKEDTLPVFLRRLKAAGFHFPVPEELPSLLCRMEKIAGIRPPLWIERERCALTELVLLLFSTIQSRFSDDLESIPVTNRQDILNRVLYYVSTQMGKRIDISKHADLVGLSERHLSRLLKEEFGMPLGKFVLHRRIESAKALLADNLTLGKDIALSLGFCDASHFCRVFRKETGMTPREYVDHLREKEHHT